MFIRMKESKGFTLVELMIVVAIIGILAAVAVPYYQKYIQKSRLTSLVFPGMHAIQTNVGSFYSLNNTFPSGTSTLTAMYSDANTLHFTPAIANNVLTLNITDTATTSPLHALSGTTLTATATTNNGKITGWTYSGSLATNLGLAGVQ
jgi:type IV pilus assembly protein PilA